MKSRREVLRTFPQPEEAKKISCAARPRALLKFWLLLRFCFSCVAFVQQQRLPFTEWSQEKRFQRVRLLPFGECEGEMYPHRPHT